MKGKERSANDLVCYTAMLVQSLPVKSKESLSNDLMNTCATDVGLVFDVKRKQTVRHKMTVLAAAFSQFSNVVFAQNGPLIHHTHTQKSLF